MDVNEDSDQTALDTPACEFYGRSCAYAIKTKIS